MSFVFEQIDAMEREKTVKDEALQRIRSWREKKKQDSDDSKESMIDNREDQNNHMERLIESNVLKKEVELVHPWPEWIELIERLVEQNYFDHKRIAEPMLIEELLVENSTVKDEGYGFTKDWIAVRNAMVNFGRDRFDILRSLSRKDIQILVGHGCPVVDPKVVYSGKLLRKYVQLNEGDVCSSCSLRSTCARAYLLASKEDEARTIDIMRLLLAFGFDPINGSCENKSVLRMKSVRTVLRKLMHEIVKLSAIPIDPTLPPPVIKKRLPKVKQPPPPPKKRIGRDDIEMKKGDWLCPKCDFMNFAKNTVCLQCDAKRPKRQLLPGEWECPECNFLNYRRNMSCFHCDHKRPPDEFIDHGQEKLRGARTKLDRVTNVPGVSKAWNFDFDDDESDGADVASFEYAADHRTNEDCFQSQPLGEFKPDILESRERIPFKRPEITHGNGFDDFDDDVDSYELDLSSSNLQKNSSTCLGSDEEADSDFNKKTSVPVQKRGSLVESDDDNNDDGFDSDGEVGVHPKWRSSHIADTRQKKSWHHSQQYGREASHSHDELELSIDSDVSDCHFNSHSNVRNKGKVRSYDSEDNSTWESDDDFLLLRNQPKGNRVGFNKKDNSSRGMNHFSSRNSRWRSNDTKHELLNASRGNKFDNMDRNSRLISKDRNSDRSSSSSNTKFDRSFTIRRGNDRERKANIYSDRRSNDRHHFIDFDGSKRNDFKYRRHIMSNNFSSRSERPSRNFDDDRVRRRIIER